jgi:hypothetical protein
MRPSTSKLCNFERHTNRLCKNYAYKGHFLCHVHDKRYHLIKTIYFVLSYICLIATMIITVDLIFTRNEFDKNYFIKQ